MKSWRLFNYLMWKLISYNEQILETQDACSLVCCQATLELYCNRPSMVGMTIAMQAYEWIATCLYANE